MPVRVITARRVDDPREVTIGQAGLPIERLDDALAEVAVQGTPSTQLRGIYEAIASDDLT